MRWLLVIIGMLFCISSALAIPVVLYDQGSGVTANGSALSSGDIAVSIWTEATGGTALYNNTFSGGIVNGTWAVQLIVDGLEYGKTYYKDYAINGVDMDFDGDERLVFTSPLGSLTNLTTIGFNQTILIDANTPGSIGIGYGTNASGADAVAIGSNANATANNSIAIGLNAKSSQQNSIGIGYRTNSSGEYSIAMGSSANATAINTIAVGAVAKSSAQNSIAIGTVASSTGGFSYAIGKSANASGLSSIALGTTAISSGNYSVAIGHYTNATHLNSIALGRTAATTENNQFMIGNPAILLNMTLNGMLNVTGEIFTNNSQVCTAANGLCSSGSSGWTSDATTTTTALNVTGGYARFDEILVTSGTIHANSSASGLTLSGSNYAGTNYGPLIQLRGSNSSTGSGNIALSLGDGLVNWSNSSFVFRNSYSQEIARFTGTGRVGIGTTTPRSTLDVNGSGSGNWGGFPSLVSFVQKDDNNWGVIFANEQRPGNIVGGYIGYDGTFILSPDGGSGLMMDTKGSNRIFLNDLSPSLQAGVVVGSLNSSDSVLAIRAPFNLAGNLTNWVNGSGHVLASVSKEGYIYENSSRVCTAANGLCGSGSSGWTSNGTTTSTTQGVVMESAQFGNVTWTGYGYGSKLSLGYNLTNFSGYSYWATTLVGDNINPDADVGGEILGSMIYETVVDSNSKNIVTLSGLFAEADHNGAGNITYMRGIAGGAMAYGAGNVNRMTGIQIGAGHGGTGSIQDNRAAWFYSGHTGAAGSIQNDYTIYLGAPWATRPLTNHYGIYLSNQSYGENDSYSIYSVDGKNYFGGNVGIGVRNATNALSVNGTANISGVIYGGSLRGRSNAQGLFLSASPEGGSNYGPLIEMFGTNHSSYPGIVDIALGASNPTPNSSYFAIYDSFYNELMRVTFGGYVGIGTPSPTQKLDVNGSGNFSGTNAQVWVNGSLVCTETNGLCAGGSSGWTSDGTTTQTAYDINVTARDSSATIITVNGVAGQTGNMQEWRDSNGTVLNYISASGKFYTNISQDAPTAIVVLNPHTGGAAKAQLTIGQYASGSNYGILEHLGSGFTPAGVRVPDRTLYTGFDTGGAGMGTGAPYPFVIFTNNTERAIVDGLTGYFGIGTSSPTQTLDVNGSINISGASAKLYAPEICLNGDCQTSWPGSVNITGMSEWLIAASDGQDATSVTNGTTVNITGGNGVTVTRSATTLQINSTTPYQSSAAGWTNTTTMTSTNLNVNLTGVLHLTPQATPGGASEGDVFFSDTLHKPCYYNSTAWVTFDGNATC